jgi:hypothetical protein
VSLRILCEKSVEVKKKKLENGTFKRFSNLTRVTPKSKKSVEVKKKSK